ncbi:MAG TPA: methyltransferase [Mycobacteriales bacterium]|jgi:SAM-dependent methyltransferase|nr:methyltransferase [Mycobacteriales bacterium]
MTATTSYLPAQATAGGLRGELQRLENQAELTFAAELDGLTRAGLQATGTLVDLGCGSGAVTRRLRAALPDATVVGADVDPELLAHVDPPVALIEDGRCPLPGAADDVLVRYVAQHLDALARAGLWALARRLLRPGGRLHVVDVADSDWGSVRPCTPELGDVYRRIAEHQQRLGGNRFVARALVAELADAGFAVPTARRLTVTSADRPLREFAVHLGAERYVPLVRAGVLTLQDLARIAAAWQALLSHPDASVTLAVHLVSAAQPDPARLEEFS